MNRIVFSRLNLALLAAMFCVTVAGFWFFPPGQKLPLHWNWHGVVDHWQSRDNALLLLPLAAGVTTLFFLVLDRWILKVDKLHGGRQYALGLSSSLGVFVVLQMMIVGHGLGYLVDVPRATTFVAAFFFIVIGNALPKMQPSALQFRWPKSLDASQQRRVRRLTGGVMMASGFGLLIAAVLNAPPVWLASATLLAALAPAAAGIACALLGPEGAHDR